MPAVEVVTDTERFKALRDEWNALAARAGTSIFQSWQWSWHWWQVYGRGKKLRVVVLRDGTKAVALAPLCLSSSYLGLPVKVLSFIGTGSTDYLGVPADPGVAGALEALFEAVYALPGWDAIDLHQLPAGRRLGEMASTHAAGAGLISSVLEQDACFCRELPASWDEYLVGLSKKFRWNVQYYARRLEREHDVTYRTSTPQTVAGDIDTFFKLHQKRFLDKKKPGAYLSPKFRRFHSELAAALCSSGHLRLHLLEVDDRAVAALYGFVFGDTFSYYLGGFEPEWGSLSVSTVLIAHAIREAIAEGCARFDFLRGNEPYKLKWGATESHNRRLVISRPGKKANLAQKLLSLENDVTQHAKELAQKS